MDQYCKKYIVIKFNQKTWLKEYAEMNTNYCTCEKTQRY